MSWESAVGRHYSVERSTNSSGAPVFTPHAVDVIGEPGTTTYTDLGPHFPHVLYRVRLIE